MSKYMKKLTLYSIFSQCQKCICYHNDDSGGNDGFQRQYILLIEWLSRGKKHMTAFGRMGKKFWVDLV